MEDGIIAKASKIKIDGTEYDFIYVNKVVRYLKELYGSFTGAMGKIEDESGEVNLEVLAELIHAGMMCNKKRIDKESIVAWLDEQPLVSAIAIARYNIPAAISATFPDSKENL